MWSNKDGVSEIVMSPIFYRNYIEVQYKSKFELEKWWTYKSDDKYGQYYHGNVVVVQFND